MQQHVPSGETQRETIGRESEAAGKNQRKGRKETEALLLCCHCTRPFSSLSAPSSSPRAATDAMLRTSTASSRLFRKLLAIEASQISAKARTKGNNRYSRPTVPPPP